jgi:hypothetical protein
MSDDEYEIDERLFEVLKDDDGIAYLGYPLNYFNPTTGKGPGNEKEAERWWPYRHDRPHDLNGILDVAANGKFMMNEIAETRESLREFVKDELVHRFLENFKAWKITTPHDNQAPQLGLDIKKL